MLRTILLCALLAMVQGVLPPNCSVLNDIGTDSSQYLVVQSRGGSRASIMGCERSSQKVWAQEVPEYDCVVGTNGIAQPGQKREGDGMTPSGDYKLGEFFGWYTAADSSVQQFKSDYRYIVDAQDLNGFYLDKFIDDPNSIYYNRWVSGPTDAGSFEQMRISAYKYGLVVNYNMDPTVPGLGSAIFMHIWSGPDGSTAGCIALDEGNLLSILQWIDKAKQPRILLLPPPL